RATARVDEHDRPALVADELDDLRVDRGPGRAARRVHARAGQSIEGVDRRLGDMCDADITTQPNTWADSSAGIGFDHRFDRNVDLQVQRLAHAGVDDRAGAPRADHEAPDLLQRVLRRAQPDALRLAAVGLQR